MMRALSILLFFAELGCSVSFSQAKPISDPFDRDMDGVKNNQHEVALVHIASECGVNIATVLPKFAVSGGSWTPVKDLARGLHALETDYFSTAQVWSNGNRVLVEMWSIDSTSGSEVRVLRCFDHGKLLQIEAIDWSLPVGPPNSKFHPWGYSRRWERDSNDRLHRVRAEFVNEFEVEIPRPKLDAEVEKGLLWVPDLGPLYQLKFPPVMLK
jgi:hypothetical protein